LEIGGFNSDLAERDSGGAEDLDFELKLVERFSLTCVPRFLVGYRVYPGNMSSNSERMARSVSLVVKRALRRNQSLPKLVVNWSFGTLYYYCYQLHRAMDNIRWIYYLFLAIWFDPMRIATLGTSIMNRTRRRVNRRKEIVMLNFGEAVPRIHLLDQDPVLAYKMIALERWDRILSGR
jgi:hypothetical protein